MTISGVGIKSLRIAAINTTGGRWSACIKMITRVILGIYSAEGGQKIKDTPKNVLNYINK